MSKHDLCNAYKIFPSHPSAWHLHGFSWLSKFFVDSTSIFVSKSAPAHSNCLGLVLALLAATICKIPKTFFVHRTLDDAPEVAPCKLRFCNKKNFNSLQKNFQTHKRQNHRYRPQKRKAFENSTKSVALGILFDIKNFYFDMGPPKSRTSRNFSSHLHFVQRASHTTKNSSGIARQMGIYSTAQSFCKSLQVAYFIFLKQFNDDENLTLRIPSNVKGDLKI
jgi:hypothetical protein